MLKYNYEDYKEANLRIADIQSILENQTEFFYEIGEDELVKEREELEKFVIEVEKETGWKW